MFWFVKVSLKVVRLRWNIQQFAFGQTDLRILSYRIHSRTFSATCIGLVFFYTACMCLCMLYNPAPGCQTQYIIIKADFNQSIQSIYFCHTQTQLAVISKYEIHLDYVWRVVPKEPMLRINRLPMYSKIKQIYCNTEIRPTIKENKNKQMYNSMKFKTQLKNQIRMNIPNT